MVTLYIKSSLNLAVVGQTHHTTPGKEAYLNWAINLITYSHTITEEYYNIPYMRPLRCTNMYLKGVINYPLQ